MPEDRFRYRRDRIAWRVLAEEAVVLDLRTHFIYFLNQTAAALWPRLEEGAGEEELAEDLGRLAGRSAGSVKGDVADWLRQLTAAGLVERTPPTISRPRENQTSFEPLQAYVPPTLAREDIAFFAGVGCGKSAPTQMECAVALRDS